MKIRVPDYYKEFDCIGSACEDTCCAGWEVVIDEETYQYYQTVTGIFGEKLQSTIISEKEKSFDLVNDNCPFLDNNHLCEIYATLGKDKLCNTCKTYPRFEQEYGELKEIGISLSCPEAARLILGRSDKPITFELEKNNDIVTTYHDIDARLYIELISCRKVVMDILQNRNMLLENRLACILTFTKTIQEKIDKNKLSQIIEVRNRYTQDNTINKILKGFQKYRSKASLKYQYMDQSIKYYRELEHINATWPIILQKVLNGLHQESNPIEYQERIVEFNHYYEEKMYQFENIILYFIFRYYLKAVFDDDIFTKVKLAVVSYLMILEMVIVFWKDNDKSIDENMFIDLVHIYSKEVEHSENNLELLQKAFQSDRLFTYEQLMTMILN